VFQVPGAKEGVDLLTCVAIYRFGSIVGDTGDMALQNIEIELLSNVLYTSLLYCNNFK
jgi:hypothetical protein